MTDPDIVDIVTLLRSPDRFEPHTCNAAADEIERLRAELVSTTNRLTAERDEARLQTGRILNEIDCRIEHGADSNGHLEAIRNLFTPNDIEAHEVRGDLPGGNP